MTASDDVNEIVAAFFDIDSAINKNVDIEKETRRIKDNSRFLEKKYNQLLSAKLPAMAAYWSEKQAPAGAVSSVSSSSKLLSVTSAEDMEKDDYFSWVMLQDKEEKDTETISLPEKTRNDKLDIVERITKAHEYAVEYHADMSSGAEISPARMNIMRNHALFIASVDRNNVPETHRTAFDNAKTCIDICTCESIENNRL